MAISELPLDDDRSMNAFLSVIDWDALPEESVSDGQPGNGTDAFLASQDVSSSGTAAERASISFVTVAPAPQPARTANIAVTVDYAPAPEGDPDQHVSACCCPACLNPRDDRVEADNNDDLAPGNTASAGSVASIDEMADFLRLGYWGNDVGSRHNLGTTGTDPNDGVLYYNVSGTDGELFFSGGLDDADGITAARAELVRDVFDVYEAVLGIDFVETTNTDDSVVDFFFIDNASGAFASSPRYGNGTIYASYVNVAESWSGGTSTYDDYTLQTLFHEVGHALGLGHQGDYNGNASYANDAIYENDSWQASMMSYFSQNENTNVDASFEYLQTPMAVDWVALNDIYGQFGYGTDNAFTDNTTYGFNTTISADTSRIWNEYSTYASRTASTIIDADGIDTVDFSGYGADQRIDLTVQTGDQTDQNTSDIGGRVGNLTLAVGTVIENAVGGSGDDRLIGNEADNVLTGGAGDDWFVGEAGDDIFYGGAGIDTVHYDIDFGDFTFSLLDDAIRAVGDGIDLIYDTVENFEFSDAMYSFVEIYDLFGNTAPVAGDDSITVAEGAALTLDVMANDTDADGDTLAITDIEGQGIVAGGSVTLASGAVVTLNANGTLAYDQNGAFAALEDGETGSETFAYTVSDGQGGADTASVSVTIDGASDGASPIGESGVARVSQTGSNQWHSVSFATAIANAVVVMGPATGNDAEALTTRVRNITDDGFEFQIDEWDYLDGVHGLESIGWLAVSEGTHTMESGRTIVASTAQVGTGFSFVNYGMALDDAIVLAETSSVNDPDAVTTRTRTVNDSGFQVQIEEQEAGSAHVDETVSWIAIEAGNSDVLQAFTTPDEVRHITARHDFDQAFATAPVLLADMQSIDGGDTSTLRMAGLDGTGVSLFVEEERSRDSEIRHTTETVGIVALDEGLIYGGTFVNSDPSALDDTASVDEGAPLTLDVLANDTDADTDALSIIDIAGQAIATGGSVTLASRAVVTLNANGTLNYGQNGIFDALNDGETGSDSFTYTVSDGRGGTASATVDLTVNGSGSGDGPIGQSGTARVTQQGSDQWHGVAFDTAIANAVVVMGPISLNGIDRTSTRVRNVTEDGFEFQIDEWDYLDGRHGLENIGWMAISEGTHTLASGQTIIASTASVGTDFSAVDFGGVLDDAIVLAEVSSVNESSAVTTRIGNVGGTGFEVQLQEEEAGGAHATETVSWIAIESGSATGIDVLRTADQLDHTADRFDFRADFGSAPVLLADMQTRDGPDTATIRMGALDRTGVSLLVEEEQSADAETTHTNEVAGYVAITDGLIYEDSFLL